MPKNIESYYQEIGRSGRDGLAAHTLLFYSFADIKKLRKFIEGTPTEKFQLAKLERMRQFAEALSCRRIALLNYFGEHIFENCGNCDICKAPPQYFDGTLLAQKVCSAVARLKQREALGMLVDVLRGSQNAAIFEKRYQHIKTYAALKDVSWQDLQQYIIQLINQGVLEIRFHQGGRLLLTPLAEDILRNGRTVRLAILEQPQKPMKKDRAPKPQAKTLFEKLRKLRAVIASEENVPAHVIFSDVSLKQMEEILPVSEEEFAAINGVGKVKQQKYAGRFLKIIEAYRQLQDSGISTQEQSLLLFRNGRSPEEIAELRSLKSETIYGHLLKCYEEGEPLDIDSFISTEEISLIAPAKKTLKAPDGLRPYFDHFEGKMPYWKIRYGLNTLTKKRAAPRAKKTIKEEVIR